EQAVESVTFKVERAQEDETVWKIVWRDKAGAALREATVRYREAELLNGAEWYRSVWRQLRGTIPIEGTGAGADLANAFWSGAADAGVSRMEGVAAAMKLADAASKSALDAARMSGCLVKAAAPGLGGRQTLDSLL